MTGELYINGQDAYQQWGVILADGSLSALMTPAPLKEYITNDSATAHGKTVALGEGATPMVDSRDVQLTVYIYANNTDTFYTRYQSFVETLQGGLIELSTKYQPNVVYWLLYLSCQQFSQFNGRLSKFVLRLNEPNPMNRNAQ